MVAVLFKSLSFTPTPEHERRARQIAVLVNDSTAPKLVRSALLSVLVQAAEVTQMRILYAPEDDSEIKVHPRDLAVLLCIAERDDLDFTEAGIVDSAGNLL